MAVLSKSEDDHGIKQTFVSSSVSIFCVIFDIHFMFIMYLCNLNYFYMLCRMYFLIHNDVDVLRVLYDELLQV